MACDVTCTQVTEIADSMPKPMHKETFMFSFGPRFPLCDISSPYLLTRHMYCMNSHLYCGDSVARMSISSVGWVLHRFNGLRLGRRVDQLSSGPQIQTGHLSNFIEPLHAVELNHQLYALVAFLVVDRGQLADDGPYCVWFLLRDLEHGRDMATGSGQTSCVVVDRPVQLSDPFIPFVKDTICLKIKAVR